MRGGAGACGMMDAMGDHASAVEVESEGGGRRACVRSARRPSGGARVRKRTSRGAGWAVLLLAAVSGLKHAESYQEKGYACSTFKNSGREGTHINFDGGARLLHTSRNNTLYVEKLRAGGHPHQLRRWGEAAAHIAQQHAVWGHFYRAASRQAGGQPCISTRFRGHAHWQHGLGGRAKHGVEGFVLAKCVLPQGVSEADQGPDADGMHTQ